MATILENPPFSKKILAVKDKLDVTHTKVMRLQVVKVRLAET